MLKRWRKLNFRSIRASFMRYHDTQKVASESAGHKFRLEHVAEFCLRPSKLKTCRTLANSRFILITRLVSLIFNDSIPFSPPSFEPISEEMSKITADEVNQNSIPLTLSEKFYEDLVLMEAASPNEGRNQGEIEEGKTLKIVYFYDLYSHQTI